VESILRSQWVDQLYTEIYDAYKSYPSLFVAGYKTPVIENLGATLVCS